MNKIPSITEIIFKNGFEGLFSIIITFEYILFIPIPVPPIITRHIPIKQINAIVIPIIAAINGKKIKNPTLSHPLHAS